MRKETLILIVLILLAVTIEVPDVNVTGVNITGLMVSVASQFLIILRMIVKQALLAIVNLL
jgi:hypothetical protein